MRLARGLLRTALHILLALLIIALYFPWASITAREGLIRWWSRRVLRICGVNVRIANAEVLESLPRGGMLVLNHISWIDIYVVHVLKPTRFVAKSEIRSWPVIGYLCERTGTIFIERGRRHAVHQANQIVANALRQGDLVGVFPEGTTTDGTHLLPFHANLIQAAVDAEALVLPVALRYLKQDAAGHEDVTQAAAYVGDMSLFDALKTLLWNKPVIAELTLLKPMTTAGQSRHQIAAATRAAIAAQLGIKPYENTDFNPAADTAGNPLETVPGLPDELL